MGLLPYAQLGPYFTLLLLRLIREVETGLVMNTWDCVHDRENMAAPLCSFFLCLHKVRVLAAWVEDLALPCPLPRK